MTHHLFAWHHLVESTVPVHHQGGQLVACRAWHADVQEGTQHLSVFSTGFDLLPGNTPKHGLSSCGQGKEQGVVVHLLCTHPTPAALQTCSQEMFANPHSRLASWDSGLCQHLIHSSSQLSPKDQRAWSVTGSATNDNWLQSKPMMIGRQMDVVVNVERESARYGIFWAIVWSDNILKGAPTKRLQLWHKHRLSWASVWWSRNEGCWKLHKSRFNTNGWFIKENLWVISGWPHFRKPPDAHMCTVVQLLGFTYEIKGNRNSIDGNSLEQAIILLR